MTCFFLAKFHLLLFNPKSFFSHEIALGKLFGVTEVQKRHTWMLIGCRRQSGSENQRIQAMSLTIFVTEGSIEQGWRSAQPNAVGGEYWVSVAIRWREPPVN